MPNVILKLNGTKIDSLEALRENFNPEEIQNAMRGVPKLQTWLREHDLDDLADQLEHVKVYMDLPEIARKLQLPDDKIKELEQEEPEEIKLLRADLRTCKQELSDKEEELRAKLEKKEEELRALKDDFEKNKKRNWNESLESIEKKVNDLQYFHNKKEFFFDLFCKTDDFDFEQTLLAFAYLPESLKNNIRRIFKLTNNDGGTSRINFYEHTHRVITVEDWIDIYNKITLFVKILCEEPTP